MKLYSNKSSCFFCLRSNSRQYLNPEGENAKEEEAQLVSSFHEFSLRNLYRFLNFLHSDKEEQDFKGLKMPICEECFQLNVEFNKLYYLLEETKLRLNWCVKKLQDVIAKSRKEEVKVAEIEDGDGNEKILEIWRAHTFDRMEAFTCAQFPQVLIHANKRKRSCSSMLTSEEGKARKMRMKDVKVMSHIHIVRAEKLGNLEETAVPVSNQEIKTAKIRKSKKCPYCSYVCGTADIRKRMGAMLKHQVRFHPEQFLLDHENETGFKPERYRQILIDIVYPKIVRNTERSTSCSLCGRSYQSDSVTENVTSIRQHLLSKHKSELKDDLKIVLEDPLLDENLNSTARKYHKEGALRICPYCDFKTNCTGSRSASGSMMAHLVRYHPEHYLIDEKDRATGSGLWNEQFRTILTSMVYPSFILKTGHHRSCSLCGTIYKSSSITENIQSMKKHLIFRHRLELRNKFKVALEDPNLEERLKDKFIARPSRKLTGAVKKEKYSPNCPYCPFKCKSHTPSQWGMVHHLVRFHPEHYLIDEEDKASGLWHEQFRTILGNMIYPNFISDSGHRRSCSLCGISYRGGQAGINNVMVKSHLLFNHKLELKEKLKLCLEDPLLEERLNTCGGKTKKRAPRGTVEKFSFKKCPYCQYKCGAKDLNARWNTMVQHLVRLHPEHFLRDEGDKEEIHKILVDILFPKFGKDMGRHTSCSLCGVKYQCNFYQQNVLSLRRHLLFQHTAELKKEIGKSIEVPLL